VGTRNQIITLTADGRRELVIQSPHRGSLRVLKRPHREGKTLKLNVKTYDISSLRMNETIEFGF
jgi:hypothetical protein